MVTVLRSDGFRIVIYLNDHEPAHVHAIGSGEAKIDILGEPRLIWADGLTRAEVRRAMRIVSEHRADLLLRWRQIHG